MATVDKMPMLAEGYERLTNEVRHLKSVERIAIIEAIEVARGHGDLSENAEYHAAKERQGHVEAQIAEMEDRLSRAMVVDPKTLSGDKVIFGATVRLKDEDGKTVTYQVVGQTEADAKIGRITLFLAARPGADRPDRRRRGRGVGAVGRQILCDQEGRIHLMNDRQLAGRAGHVRHRRDHDSVLAAPLARSRTEGDRSGAGRRFHAGAGFLRQRRGHCPAAPDAADRDPDPWRRRCISSSPWSGCSSAAKSSKRSSPRAGMIILYIAGAYAAAAAHYATGPGSDFTLIGASGAVSAVIGAYAILLGRNKLRVAGPSRGLWLNALWLAAAWIAIQAMIAFAYGAPLLRIPVAALAGGFLIGLALAKPLLLLRWRGA